MTQMRISMGKYYTEKEWENRRLKVLGKDYIDYPESLDHHYYRPSGYHKRKIKKQIIKQWRVFWTFCKDIYHEIFQQIKEDTLLPPVLFVYIIFILLLLFHFSTNL